MKKGSVAVRWLFPVLSETWPTFLSPDAAFMGTEVLIGKSVHFRPAPLLPDSYLGSKKNKHFPRFFCLFHLHKSLVFASKMFNTLKFGISLFTHKPLKMCVHEPESFRRKSQCISKPPPKSLMYSTLFAFCHRVVMFCQQKEKCTLSCLLTAAAESLRWYGLLSPLGETHAHTEGRRSSSLATHTHTHNLLEGQQIPKKPVLSNHKNSE